jgi:ankyrin repeat protein
MRKYIYIILATCLISCNNYLPGFDFENFKGTKAYELAIAVEKENTKKIEAIIEGNKNLIDYTEPKFGHTLLMLSVANNLQKSVKKLLELGADPNKKSEIINDKISETTTAVFVASNKIYTRDCNTDILELLVQNGGEINDKIDVKYLNSNYITKETPLMIAAKSNCIDLVKKIVELGADINNYDYSYGKGPLSNSIIHDNLNILEYLVIEKKALIPKYVFVRPAHNNTPKEELTMIEFLEEQNYTKDSENYRYRERIINYLINSGHKE